ncbi:long-chain-fatty-acid--CoA ligase [Spongiibacter nanhainus]|uniref:Long-chain-fatty-acid--CoA ligase n=1 Tax=Spongiibacter nanhainus TaxID=2794344 RepID=A0A7T4R206_9GAMM|nr:long-chain-fatty-acid--CoA ligase [Spongiibacter nanhainus]QQD18986.1 long-chain-fatty-acid--CoA ligase [Spongiibacter nanhainus]
MFTPMMTTPLTITSLMHHAERVNGLVEVVSVTADNPRHRYTYRDAFKRARQLANALKTLGLKPGDTVGTVAWNDYRHLEIYYAVSCSGMVCHTLNPRLFPEQLEYIINHGEDQWICIDPTLVPLIEPLKDKIPKVKGFIVMTDEAHMPDTKLDQVLCYESLIAEQSDQFDWPELDENTPAALCYTSGTTGNPKGVLYTHRSTLLHCYASICADVFGLSIKDVALPIVPMFHVNGWGMVYSAPMVGTKLVMPGPKMGDGETLCTLINEEKVTVSAGVPTVWLALLNYLQQSGSKVESLQRITSGGAACPFVVYDEMRSKYDVDVQIGWGMTEMNPLGTYNGNCPPALESLPQEELDQLRLKAGRPVFGVDIKIEGEDGQELPWDGKSSGAIKVRGPWIINEYFHYDKPTLDDDGWFETGDVGCMDEWGYLQITDRLKDVIKSGGEWISSIELENCAVNHPDVAEAAVIGLPHPKWSERPLLVVVMKEGKTIDKQEMLGWLEGKVASWWIPSDCVFVDELPHTATGKISKKDLRVQFADFQWSE